MAIDLSWTRDEVLDQIDIPFLGALTRSFEDHPPLRRIAAALAGVKPKRRPSDFAELIAMFPQGVIK